MDVSRQHIVILGNNKVDGYSTFLTEFYHQDHGDIIIQTIILREKPPDEDFLKIIKENNFQSKVLYLEGNPLNIKDL